MAHEDAQDQCKEAWNQHSEVRDQADWEFWAQLLALMYEWVKALQEQTTVLERAVQATGNDCQVLDTILALAIIFMPTHCPTPDPSPGCSLEATCCLAA
ncbi:hypothetical protein Y1Q_0022049 [Alligator mississippiensis]|uniref:Uncharacterized protein n=1 Tax=Alligator mississippiensis TaxID=8496 RepID=A0A151NLT8_ALLMI|nr:hypothetical protein Y1Q_0022049 [Alligator mississippiensis]